jgi:hypothetical protein
MANVYIVTDTQASLRIRLLISLSVIIIALASDLGSIQQNFSAFCSITDQKKIRTYAQDIGRLGCRGSISLKREVHEPN